MIRILNIFKDNDCYLYIEENTNKTEKLVKIRARLVSLSQLFTKGEDLDELKKHCIEELKFREHNTIDKKTSKACLFLITEIEKTYQTSLL